VRVFDSQPPGTHPFSQHPKLFLFRFPRRSLCFKGPPSRTPPALCMVDLSFRSCPPLVCEPLQLANPRSTRPLQQSHPHFGFLRPEIEETVSYFLFFLVLFPFYLSGSTHALILPFIPELLTPPPAPFFFLLPNLVNKTARKSTSSKLAQSLS